MVAVQGRGMGGSWGEARAGINVRSVSFTDAPALHQLDYSFETERIYTLRVGGTLGKSDSTLHAPGKPALAFELWETPVEPPLYKSYREYDRTLAEVEAKLTGIAGGYIALAGEQAAGVVLLNF